MKYTLFIPLLISLFTCQKEEEKVPHKDGLDIEVNGVLNEIAWEKALIFNASEKNKVLLIQNDEYFFIGIDNDEDILRYVDIYIDNGITETINFHASMQLGERKLSNNWNDTIPHWNWGNNKNWLANSLLIQGQDLENWSKEAFNRYNDYEFKISTDQLKNKKLRMYFEIRDMFGEAANIYFPMDSIRYSIESWCKISL